MNETLKVLEERRSCRKFKPDMITEEELNSVIRAGTFAPTGMGKQSPIIIAVTNKETRDKIAKENAKIAGWKEDFDPFYGAPVILIVLANRGVNQEIGTYLYDGSLVMGNMLNAAESLGLGSIWIEFFDTEKLKQEFNLDRNIEPICLIPIGYVADDYNGNPMHNVRKNIEDIVEYK